MSSQVSVERKWFVWRNTLPTRGRAAACSTNMSELNDNTSRWPANSDLRPRARCWETSDCPIVVWAPSHLPASNQSQETSNNNQIKWDNKLHRTALWQSPQHDVLKLCACSVCSSALVKNICRECVSVKSLLCGRGQEVTISLWVTAVMASGGYI